MAPKAKAKEKVLTEEEQALADAREGVIQEALDIGVRGVLGPGQAADSCSGSQRADATNADARLAGRQADTAPPLHGQLAAATPVVLCL